MLGYGVVYFKKFDELMKENFEFLLEDEYFEINEDEILLEECNNEC